VEGSTKVEMVKSGIDMCEMRWNFWKAVKMESQWLQMGEVGDQGHANFIWD